MLKVDQGESKIFDESWSSFGKIPKKRIIRNLDKSQEHTAVGN